MRSEKKGEGVYRREMIKQEKCFEKRGTKERKGIVRERLAGMDE